MSDLKQKILADVKDDLAGIEKALKENLTPYLDIISQIAGHILFSGGKRLRPLLMVLSARLCDYKGNHDKTYSTVLSIYFPKSNKVFFKTISEFCSEILFGGFYEFI